MKARIKKTGEVLRVSDVTDNYVYLISPQGGEDICLPIENVQLLDDCQSKVDHIDWEQRRYEIAKEAMAGILSSDEQTGYACTEAIYLKGEKRTTPKAVSRYAIACADALIEELRLRGFQD